MSTSPQTAPLHLCDNCHKAAGPKVQLKKCSGCHILYCSKECQKAQWPYHKAMCQRFRIKPGALPSEVQLPRGSVSTNELGQAFTDFTNAHAWAIETAARTLALGFFGLDYLNHASDGTARFVFEYNGTTDGPRRNANPAQLFKLADLKLVDIMTWAKPGQTRAEVAESFAKIRQNALEHFLRQSTWRKPIGVLQVGYTIRGEAATHWQCFPQYRSPGIIPPPPIRGGDIGEQFADLIRLCSGSINGGFAFRPVNGTLFVYPGRYTRTKHQWTWEALFSDWEEYRQHRANYPELTALNDMRSGKTPEELMFLLSLY